MTISQAIQWRRNGERQWVRGCTGTEKNLFMTDEFFHEGNVLVNVLIKSQGDWDFKYVAARLRRSWIATYAQLPRLSTTMDRSGESDFEARYEQVVELPDVEKWANETFRSRLANAAAGITEETAWAYLDTHRQDFAMEGISREKGHVGLIDVIDFGSDAAYTGLTLCFDHALFDGPGTFGVLDRLLQNYVEHGQANLDKPLVKAEPDTTLLAFLDHETLDADYSGAVGSIIAGSENDSESAYPLAPVTRLKHQGRVAAISHTFTADETTKLLAAAKRHQMSISMVAFATHIVALLKRLPFDSSDEKNARRMHIPIGGPVNVRQLLPQSKGVEKSSGAVVVLVSHNIALESMTESLLRGEVETTEDIEVLLSLSRTLKDETEKTKKGFGPRLALFDAFSRETTKSGQLPPRPPGTMSFVVSDGLLERFLSRTYGKGDDALQVVNASVIVNNQNPFVTGRTVTFAGRLTLCYNFNGELWESEGIETKTMAKDWADALKRVLDV